MIERRKFNQESNSRTRPGIRIATAIVVAAALEMTSSVLGRESSSEPVEVALLGHTCLSKTKGYIPMKMSRYNLILTDENNGDSNLVYNTLTGAIARVNRALGDVLKSNDFFGILHAGFDEELAELGFLVPDGIDELDRYRQIHRRWKSGRELTEFNMLITYDCNFACPYCYQGRGEEGLRVHSFESMDADMIAMFKRFVMHTVEARQSQCLELVLYGGEPLLMEKQCRETTDDLAEWARQNGVRFKLNMLSNGSLLTASFVKWASGHNMRLQIPVDGDPSQHNSIRSYKEDDRGSFDDVSEALALTGGANVETHIRVSLTDDTYPTMENMLNILEERGLTHLYVDFCYITAFTEACANYGEHVLEDHKLFDVMPQLWREAYARGFKLDIRPRPQALPCSSIADGSYIVDPFGDVYKCWELVGLKEHVVGTLNRDGTLNKTDIYDDVLSRDPTELERCASHVYLPSCGGGCVCKAFWQTGTYQTPGCGTEHFLLPEKVKMYYETRKPLDSPIQISYDMEMQVVDGDIEPSMSHCYVLV